MTLKTIKGPAIFLAQFMGDQPPFDNLKTICKWAASLGYVGVQMPTWDPRCIDLKQAAESKDYCDELKGTVESCGVQILRTLYALAGTACRKSVRLTMSSSMPLHPNPSER